MDNNELKVALKLKDNFAKSRYNEKKDLIVIRHELGMKILDARDKVAVKRHSERIEILKRRLI